MGNYFIMDSWGPEQDEPTQMPENVKFGRIEIQWFMGMKIPVEVEQPIRIEWSSRLKGGGQAWSMLGEPSVGPRNSKGVRRQWAYPTKTPPLFHRDLVSELSECGIDNIDLYETEIVDTKTMEVEHGFLAVNVVGLVKAANLEMSDATLNTPDGLIDTDFDSLVIDESATHGVRLFRLAESVNAIVVHRSVKEHLESRGGFELTFTSPEKWIG